MFTLDFIEYCAILDGVVNKDCVFFEKFIPFDWLGRKIFMTIYTIFNFFRSLNPNAEAEKAVKNAAEAVKNAEAKKAEAERKNDLKAYKKAEAEAKNAEAKKAEAVKVLESSERITQNDLIQLSTLTACLLGIQYTQNDLIQLGASSTGQFGYYKRSIRLFNRFGFTLTAEGLEKAIDAQNPEPLNN